MAPARPASPATNPLRLRTSPEQDRSRRRVEALLDAAQDLIAERGIEPITMTAIAARAGMSLPALYRYFPDRSAVVRALVLRLFERDSAAVQTETAEALAAGATVAATVRDLFLAQRRREDEQPYRVALRAAVAADPELAALDVADSRATADGLLDPVARRTGRTDLDALHRQLLLTIHLAGAAVQLTGLVEDSNEADALLETYVDLVTTMLTGPAAGGRP